MKLLQEMASPGYEAIRKCTAEINQALAYNVDLVWFSSRLYAEGFITQHKHSNVHNTPDNLSKANNLMESVRSHVKINPDKYNKFLDILKEEPALNSVVQLLNSRTHNQGGTLCILVHGYIISTIFITCSYRATVKIGG